MADTIIDETVAMGVPKSTPKVTTVYKHLGKVVSIGSKKVTIKLVDKFTLLPTDAAAQYMKEEVTKKIGSTWKAGTRDVLRGLTPEEEKKYLPAMLGVAHTSDQWNDKVLNHWCNFTIDVPNNEIGLELETGFRVVSEDEKLAEPISLKDYMEYNFAIQHSQVASTEEQLDNKFIYTYYIVDNNKDAQVRESMYDVRKTANEKFIKLTNGEHKNRINWILETKGGINNTGIRVENLSDIQKEIELEKMKDKNPALFIEIVSDKLLETKALIYKAVSLGILNMQGNSYFLDNQLLGSNEKETVGYLDNQNNQGIKLGIIAKIQAYKS